MEAAIREGRGQGGCGGTLRGEWSGRGLRAPREPVGMALEGAAGSRGAWPGGAAAGSGGRAGGWQGAEGLRGRGEGAERQGLGAGRLRGRCGEVSQTPEGGEGRGEEARPQGERGWEAIPEARRSDNGAQGRRAGLEGRGGPASPG